MASSKLSALTALTSVGNDDLVYVADTADGGTTYASKKVTKANLFSGYATETYVSTQISNLIDGAPDALNTLNELAAALNDDTNAATNLTTLINANTNGLAALLAGTSIPGPYADDAAAASGGVAVGAIYKANAGTINWRVS